jgi:glycolate dehydrogenase FAD-binding subunit
MAASPAREDLIVSTARLNRVLEYNPRDLTVSVQSGMPFAELSRVLAENRQVIALDPPYFDSATVGGIVAANSCGPRRRLYGSARDLVIGMTFATLEGKLVKSGGMVVKNVAGLDMAKLMIGSFGTLAAVASVNCKLAPMPPESRTFMLRFATSAECFAARSRVLAGVLQPAAIDVLNPPAAELAGLERTYTLLIEAGGSPAVLARYRRELPDAAVLRAEQHERAWTSVREFTPDFLAGRPDSQVVRVSTTLQAVREVMDSFTVPALARAGSGICYGYFEDAAQAVAWTARAAGWRYVFEYGEPRSAGVLDAELAVMRKLKDLFDPGHLLNRGMLYGML